MRTVSALSNHFHVEKEYARQTNAIVDTKIKQYHVVGIGFGGANCVLFLTYALLFWYGGELINKGQVTFEGTRRLRQ